MFTLEVIHIPGVFTRRGFTVLMKLKLLADIVNDDSDVYEAYR